MDVQMPEMGGLEATAAIRQREGITGRRHPIIALTAHAMKGDEERCIAAGMDGYLTKPIRPEALDEILKRIARSEVSFSTAGTTLRQTVLGSPDFE
jgi:CheY-like chemotaxis protein